MCLYLKYEASDVKIIICLDHLVLGYPNVFVAEKENGDGLRKPFFGFSLHMDLFIFSLIHIFN